MAKLAQKVAEGAARYVTAEAQGAELLLQNLDVWAATTRTKSTNPSWLCETGSNFNMPVYSRSNGLSW